MVVFQGETIFSAPVTIGSGTVVIAKPFGTADITCCDVYYVPETLTATDAAGTFTMALDPASGGLGTPPSWTGCITINRLSADAEDTGGGGCTLFASSVQAINVGYIMRCNAGLIPVFDVIRAWAWTQDSSSANVYFWNGGIACPVPGTTFPNINGPSVLCPGALDTAIGTGTPSSSSPFAISFGSLTPNVFNTMPDPIGGGVTISQ